MVGDEGDLVRERRRVAGNSHPLDRLVRREMHVGGCGVEGAGSSSSVGMRTNDSASPVHATAPGRPAPPRRRPSHPTTRHHEVGGGAVPRSRFIGTIENCIEAPPWQNRTRWSSADPEERAEVGLRLLDHARRTRRRDGRPRAAEAPTPGSVGRSACACSRTGSGRTPGPAEKLMTRPSVRTEPGYRGCAGFRSPACTPSATAGWPARRRR